MIWQRALDFGGVSDRSGGSPADDGFRADLEWDTVGGATASMHLGFYRRGTLAGPEARERLRRQMNYAGW